MMYDLKLRAFTSATKVRQFCIDHGFYTRGDNQAYGELLDYVQGHTYMDKITLSTIINDIVKHSEIDLDDMMAFDVEDAKQVVATMFINEACLIGID